MTEVVAAVIFHEGFFLCVQKGAHKLPYLQYKFEFPGGKTESGESAEAALVREIREELGMEIQPLRQLLTVQHAYEDVSIRLQAWLCSCSERELVLREHISFRWEKAENLFTLDWAAADLPIVKFLQEALVAE